jgi:ElaB/YqjD/DUF883 family membrane-anchored ribosome-binding protein
MPTESTNQLIDGAAKLAQQALSAPHRAIEAAGDASRQMLARANRASDRTVAYIRDEPVRSMLVAAATGAALATILGLLMRWRGRD